MLLLKYVTLFGIVTLSNEVQPRNVRAPISPTPDGIATFLSELHP